MDIKSDRKRERAKDRLYLKLEIVSDMETKRGVNTDTALICMRKNGSGRG